MGTGILNDLRVLLQEATNPTAATLEVLLAISRTLSHFPAQHAHLNDLHKTIEEVRQTITTIGAKRGSSSGDGQATAEDTQERIDG